MPFFMAGLLFGADGCLLVNPLTPASTDTYNAPFRVDRKGMVFISEDGTPAATDTYNAGMRFSPTGQLYVTTAAVDAASETSGGISRDVDGRVHVTFVEPSPKFQNGPFCVSGTGQLYVAGPPAADMELWTRFNMGITSANSLVSAWADQSGEDHHLLQATEANQPTEQSDGSILFNGTDEYLKAVAFTFDQPLTIYVLGKQVTWTLNDAIIDGDSTTGCRIFQRTSSPNIGLTAGTSTNFLNSEWAVDTYAAVAAVFNGASSVLQINDNEADTGDAGAGDAGGCTLGAAGNLSSFANIRAKEVIEYSAAHDADTRARVINYLGAIGDLGL